MQGAGGDNDDDVPVPEGLDFAAVANVDVQATPCGQLDGEGGKAPKASEASEAGGAASDKAGKVGKATKAGETSRVGAAKPRTPPDPYANNPGACAYAKAVAAASAKARARAADHAIAAGSDGTESLLSVTDEQAAERAGFHEQLLAAASKDKALGARTVPAKASVDPDLARPPQSANLLKVLQKQDAMKIDEARMLVEERRLLDEQKHELQVQLAEKDTLVEKLRVEKNMLTEVEKHERSKLTEAERREFELARKAQQVKDVNSAKIALNKAALNRGGNVLTARAEDVKREQETAQSIEMKKYNEEKPLGKWQISAKEREFVEMAAAKMAAQDPGRLERLTAQVRAKKKKSDDVYGYKLDLADAKQHQLQEVNDTTTALHNAAYSGRARPKPTDSTLQDTPHKGNSPRAIKGSDEYLKNKTAQLASGGTALATATGGGGGEAEGDGGVSWGVAVKAAEALSGRRYCTDAVDAEMMGAVWEHGLTEANEAALLVRSDNLLAELGEGFEWLKPLHDQLIPSLARNARAGPVYYNGEDPGPPHGGTLARDAKDIQRLRALRVVFPNWLEHAPDFVPKFEPTPAWIDALAKQHPQPKARTLDDRTRQYTDKLRVARQDLRYDCTVGNLDAQGSVDGVEGTYMQRVQRALFEMDPNHPVWTILCGAPNHPMWQNKANVKPSASDVEDVWTLCKDSIKWVKMSTGAVRSRKRAVKCFGWVFFLISSGSPHVRPMGRTCGEPDEIELTAMGVKLNGSRCRASWRRCPRRWPCSWSHVSMPSACSTSPPPTGPAKAGARSTASPRARCSASTCLEKER